MDQPVTDDSRFSRRQLLKRGAVVGGIVWATPVVQSFTSPAFAQGTPREGECEDGSLVRGYVKFDVTTSTFEDLGQAPSTSAGVCLSPLDYCKEVSEYLAAHFNLHATVEFTGEETDEGVCITIPDDCTMIETAAAKEPCTEGPDCDFTPDAGTDLPRTVCFLKGECTEGGGRGGGVSHIEIGVCCCVPNAVIAECDSAPSDCLD